MFLYFQDKHFPIGEMLQSTLLISLFSHCCAFSPESQILKSHLPQLPHIAVSITGPVRLLKVVLPVLPLSHALPCTLSGFPSSMPPPSPTPANTADAQGGESTCLPVVPFLLSWVLVPQVQVFATTLQRHWTHALLFNLLFLAAFGEDLDVLQGTLLYLEQKDFKSLCAIVRHMQKKIVSVPLISQKMLHMY